MTTGSGGSTAFLRAWLTHLKTERGMAANTVENYRRDVEAYLEWVAREHGGQLDAVSARDIEAYIAHLRADLGRAATSVARSLAAIRGFHGFAVAEGFVQQDASADVASPARGQTLPKALSVHEVTVLLQSAAQAAQNEGANPLELRDWALLELLYSTGARISEVLGLNIDDVDAAEQVVVLTGKGSKQRLVPIGTPALEALEHYLVRARPALVAKSKATAPAAIFVNQRGRRMGRQSGYNVVAAAAERVGLDGVSPHSLRHSYATHLLEGGADVRVVQELLGHATVVTTQVYTKVSAEHLRSAWAAAHPRR